MAYTPCAPRGTHTHTIQWDGVSDFIRGEPDWQLSDMLTVWVLSVYEESMLAWTSARHEGQLCSSTDLFSPNSSGDGAENEAQSSLDPEVPSTAVGLDDIEFGLD